MLEQMHPFWPRVSDFVVLGSNDRKNRVQKFCEFKDLNDFIGFQTYGILMNQNKINEISKHLNISTSLNDSKQYVLTNKIINLHLIWQSVLSW